MPKRTEQKEIISPIAIDLGAKNTGVYFAHYEAGSSPDTLCKEGKVYQLEENKFTLLMANRTATRHQRRGYDRRRMAKRLFKLIWCKHFGLQWDKDVQQTVSFLLNRRGFSFLKEEYNPEALSQFPDDLLGYLPNELRQVSETGHESNDYRSILEEWAYNNDLDKLKDAKTAINLEPNKIRKELVRISITETLHEYCFSQKEGGKFPGKKKDKLSRLSAWILESWLKDGVQGLPHGPFGNTVDIVGYLDKQDSTVIEDILGSLQDPKSLKQQKTDLKKSMWFFNSGKINMENVAFGGNTDSDGFARAHLHHLAFAIGKVYDELDSGGRHRSKYFGEIESVLEKKDHRSGYLKRFCEQLDSGGYRGLTVKSLSSLIGHISNLELKPLRKYFNDKKHAAGKTNKDGDQWDLDSITKLFRLWIMKEWRVNPEKDKLKAEGKIADYQELKRQWQDRQGSVVDFWLNTDPNYTVPPYQDNNNRRPPKCQSLLLNVDYLNERYPQWRVWVNALKEIDPVSEYLGGYDKDLENLRSGKGNAYFAYENSGSLLVDSGRRGQAALDARVLQFILDRVKAQDHLKLNEIYSHAKKMKQDTRDGESTKDAREKLQEALSGSQIPEALKDGADGGIFPEKSFLHLACKYYKFRQRAKAGRIYIHPEYRKTKGRGYENTGRYDSNQLLSYCNHKPRQKRYQMLGDLATLLQVPPHELKQKVGGKKSADGPPEEPLADRLVKWLSDIDGMKTNCGVAADEQKNRRGRLKLDIQNVFGLIYNKRKDKNEPPSPKEIKEILKSSLVDNAGKLHKFCLSARKLCGTLSSFLYNEKTQSVFLEDIKKNPARAVYLLAQINNIAFKDRGGNASVCAVCSADNAYRMRMVAATGGDGATTKAQRLPAIPARMFDGAVMRVARVVGGAIAEDKWSKIEEDLDAGNRVCVPIIAESNRFEFEPSKEELVKRQRTAARKGRVVKRSEEDSLLKSKNERIKLKTDSIMGGNKDAICPYNGDRISDGEIDHIIPRQERWGVLNDEANLIWASRRGNEHKSNRMLSLSDLSPAYKQSIFPGMIDDEIAGGIRATIGDGSGERFLFGEYRNFRNLDADEQKAFRHALFLTGDPLQEKVIRAIDNRNRAFVNGTQRYFAEVIANDLYRRAKKKGDKAAKMLSFDYYGVEAWDTDRGGDGIKELREMYESVDSRIAAYAKDGKTQHAYSHLIDAQLAFVIVADAHRNKGGLRLRIEDGIKREPSLDRETGELSGLLYPALVPESDCEVRSLKRRKVYDVETHHRESLAMGDKNAVSISYQIHKSNFIAERFMPIIQLKNGCLKKGYSLANSVEYTQDDFEQIKKFFRPCKNNASVWRVQRKEALSYLVNAGRNGLDKDEQKTARLLDGLIYGTIKKEVSLVLTRKKGDPPPATVSDALANWDKCKDVQKSTYEKNGVVLPEYYVWEKLKTYLEDADPDQSLRDFLKDSEMFRNRQASNFKHHNKKRKVYSLPVISEIGTIRLSRRAWTAQSILQTAAKKGIAKYGRGGRQRPHTILSKNSIPVKHYYGIPEELHPEPREWERITDEDIVKYNKDGDIDILSGKVIYQDPGRCRVRFRVKDIRQLCLPHDMQTWKGKVFRYENAGDLQEKLTQGNRGHHCLLEDWRWFLSPYTVPFVRHKTKRGVSISSHEVEINKIDGVCEVEFTIARGIDKVLAS